VQVTARGLSCGLMRSVIGAFYLFSLLTYTHTQTVFEANNQINGFTKQLLACSCPFALCCPTLLVLAAKLGGNTSPQRK
jgi:hypothetical protein